MVKGLLDAPPPPNRKPSGVSSVTAFMCSDGSIHPTLMIAEEHEKAVQLAELVDEAAMFLENDMLISNASGEEIITTLLEKYILTRRD